MTKQKRGFWLFLFSLIPGAGEMYMGFRKQGISIMLLFWGIIAVSAGTGFGWIIMFLPILWFYSFFNVHNLKSLSEEEFYSLEDNYVLHLDQLIGDADILISKHRTIVAALLIFFGVSILWNNFTDFVYWFLPAPFANLINSISYRLPQLIIAVAIIAAGCYILSHKKARLENEYKTSPKEEHYWEPYRPYQQTRSAEAERTAPTASTVVQPQNRHNYSPEMTAENTQSQQIIDPQSLYGTSENDASPKMTSHPEDTASPAELNTDTSVQ